ncbi:hypothetical protein D3C83_269020 [compost metagenome]
MHRLGQGFGALEDLHRGVVAAERIATGQRAARRDCQAGSQQAAAFAALLEEGLACFHLGSLQ